MDLRRLGEFAFGIGVFMCGGAFLLLAVERLSAPVVTGVPASAPIVAAAASPPVTATALAPPVIARRSTAAHVVLVRHTSTAVEKKPQRKFTAHPQRRAARLIAAAPVQLERPRTTMPPTKQIAPSPVHTPQPENVAVAATHRPDAKRSPSPSPRMLAVANRTHRSRIAPSRTPRSDATPEPPIGYDDHPALVRSDGPSAALPTMDPAQVELTTTHLGH